MSKFMEVLSRGRYEEQENISHPSTARTDGIQSLLSLELLPPEAPYFVLSEVEMPSNEGEATTEENNLNEDVCPVDEMAESEGERGTEYAEEANATGAEDIFSGLHVNYSITGELLEYFMSSNSDLSSLEVVGETRGTGTAEEGDEEEREDGEEQGGEERVVDDGEEDEGDEGKVKEEEEDEEEEEEVEEEEEQDEDEVDEMVMVELQRDDAESDMFLSENNVTSDHSVDRSDQGLTDHKGPITTSRETQMKKQRNTNCIESCFPSADGCSTPTSCVSASEGSSDCQFSDLRTQRAYEKMIKLDQKLAKLCKREKELKKQRKLLEEEMNMESSSLALVTQSSSNVAGSKSCIIPVFHTQPRGTYMADKKKCKLGEKYKDDGGGCSSSPDETETGKGRKRGEAAQHEKYFIKRNIELVADAGSLVMMTNAEKQRLQQLLEDDHADEQQMDVDNGTVMCKKQPLSLSMDKPFAFDSMAMERMKEIHSQLGALLSEKNNQSTCTSSNDITIYSPSPPPSATIYAIGAELEEGRSSHEEKKDEEHVNDEDHSNVHNKEVGDEVMDRDIDDVGEERNGELSHGSDDVDVGENELEREFEVDDGYDEGDALPVCVEDGKRENRRKKFDEEGEWKAHDAQSRGVLVRACLTVEERERMYLVDERLRHLHEDGDKYKKLLSDDRLRLLSNQCREYSIPEEALQQ